MEASPFLPQCRPLAKVWETVVLFGEISVTKLDNPPSPSPDSLTWNTPNKLSASKGSKIKYAEVTFVVEYHESTFSTEGKGKGLRSLTTRSALNISSILASISRPYYNTLRRLSKYLKGRPEKAMAPSPLYP